MRARMTPERQRKTACVGVCAHGDKQDVQGCIVVEEQRYQLPPSKPYRAVWFGVKEQQLDLLRTALCCACELLACIDTVQRKGV